LDPFPSVPALHSQDRPVWSQVIMLATLKKDGKQKQVMQFILVGILEKWLTCIMRCNAATQVMTPITLRRHMMIPTRLLKREQSF